MPLWRLLAVFIGSSVGSLAYNFLNDFLQFLKYLDRNHATHKLIKNKTNDKNCLPHRIRNWFTKTFKSCSYPGQ